MKNIAKLVMAVMCDGQPRSLNRIANEIENLCADRVSNSEVMSALMCANQGEKICSFGWAVVEHPACIYHLEAVRHPDPVPSFSEIESRIVSHAKAIDELMEVRKIKEQI